MGRVFTNGSGDRVQYQVRSNQRLKKWYLIPPCLTLSIIRYVIRVKWSNPGNGVAASPTFRCSSDWKGSLLFTLDYIYIYTRFGCEVQSLTNVLLSHMIKWDSIFNIDPPQFMHFFHRCCKGWIPLVKKVLKSKHADIFWAFQPMNYSTIHHIYKIFTTESLDLLIIKRRNWQ